jgi:hypothetical protein
MSYRNFPRVVAVFALLGAVAVGRAELVEVSAVRFGNLRAPNGSPGNWHEAAINLTVKPQTGAPSQMVSRVRVALLVGFELPATSGAERRLDYYRAEVECVALEPGRADVRFYLPPEVVKRDSLHGDPKYWGVEVAVEGKPLLASRAAYSSSLAGVEQRKNFQKRGAAAATVNEGVLVPQYFSPFVNEYPRATPSYVRKDPR